MEASGRILGHYGTVSFGVWSKGEIIIQIEIISFRMSRRTLNLDNFRPSYSMFEMGPLFKQGHFDGGYVSGFDECPAVSRDRWGMILWH